MADRPRLSQLAFDAHQWCRCVPGAAAWQLLDLSRHEALKERITRLSSLLLWNPSGI